MLLTDRSPKSHDAVLTVARFDQSTLMDIYYRAMKGTLVEPVQGRRIVKHTVPRSAIRDFWQHPDAGPRIPGPKPLTGNDGWTTHFELWTPDGGLNESSAWCPEEGSGIARFIERLGVLANSVLAEPITVLPSYW